MDPITAALDAAQRQLPSIECRLNEPMKNHTSFKIGGPVRAMFLPKSTQELINLHSVLRESGINPFVMGNGTNLLVADCAPELCVIKTTELRDIELVSETQIRADCGVLLSKLAVFACRHGLCGLEFAHGIPGTLGGAVSMNAGAYGGEMKDVVVETQAVGAAGSFAVTEHEFSYRHSRFSDCNDVILSTAMQLQKGDSESIRAQMDDLAARRRESQPLELSSAGSTFKRPAGGYAAALIDQSGLKGFSIGGAAVSDKHAGFIVNRGGASFDDVMAVIEHVRQTVFKRFGIELMPEIKIIRSNNRFVEV